jgi:integrase
MERKGRSPRSMGTIKTEIPRLMKAWLDRPIVDLKGAELVALHDKLTKDNGPFLANRLVAHVSAVWNALDRVHELEGRNPARAVTRHRYVPKRERIDDADLPSWWATVQGLTPVRRDLRIFCLTTGMRDEAARHVRWEHIDFKRASLTVPKPKGGEAKAFTLPLGPRLVERLKERQRQNETLFADHGGDHGWAFPALSRFRDEETGAVQVIAMRESKEYREVIDAKGKSHRERLIVGNHTSRRTFLSVATEIGIGELDRHALANHAFGRQSVNATYIAQAFGHLADCQRRIEEAIWKKIEAGNAVGSARRKPRKKAA